MGLVVFWLRPTVGFILSIPIGAALYLALLVATGSLRKEHLVLARQMLRR